ncbi:hypothetical protein THRCLA_21638 [Thraustotheca clavata]|uniref:Uncharacterized protein n=1 Tax=Thraustotheca clavata TaxID=74557 RepID=A0A1V9ZSZ2_9STRA|nr:hypothetical protein THRCLA_21638 [Thraustotheca clavata]
MVEYINTGRWLAEELTYLELLIKCFVLGILDDDANSCTLRQYLSQQLHCKPLRVTKRLKCGKMLGQYQLSSSFHRQLYRKTINITPLDVDLLMELRNAQIRFEAALQMKLALQNGLFIPTTRRYLSVEDQLNPLTKNDVI